MHQKIFVRGQFQTWFRLFMLGLVVLASSQFTPAQTKPALGVTVDQVCENIRKAVNYEALIKNSSGLVIKGEAVYVGVDHTFELAWTPDGKFMEQLSGRLKVRTAFDGKKTWTTDWSGLPYPMALEDHETSRLEYWLRTFYWLNPKAPVEIRPIADQTTSDQMALGVKIKDGLTEATILIDRKTWLPTSFKYGVTGPPQEWKLRDYKPVRGIHFPHTAENTVRGLINSYRLKTIVPLENKADAQFEYQPTIPGDTTWSDLPPTIEMKRTRTGHYLVHPKINGKDMGWFIFDSGAGSMVISKTVAKELELPVFGQIPVGGVGGYTQSSLCEGKLFELGPISIHNTIYLEYDFGQLSAIFGEKIAGICGFDLFTRAVVALDSTTNQIEIHNPAKFELPNARWQDMIIVDRHPHVRCRFEGDREGVFKIDTGANSTVIFTTQAVDSFKLLENRKTESSKSGGVGGTVETRRGQLDWIEFGGQRFTNQIAMFSQAKEGALSNPYLTGVIGAPLLEPFKVFFHYGGMKIAFAPKTK